MNGVIGLLGTLALLLAAGGAIGLIDRRGFRPGWLLTAAALVAANDALLTRAYRHIPDLIPAADWNWQKDRAALPEGSVSLTSDSRTWSLGAGPGVAVRYWFREDHYNAPRSYLDWSMQYRFPIGGGNTEQAKGLFMNLTLSY